MKGGIVTTIRINPKDCQSVLDVMEKAGIHTSGMSFSAMAALAFQSLMEAAREAGNLPEPDEFQYLNRLQPYLRAKHGRKLEVTKVMNGLGATLKAPKLPEASRRLVEEATAQTPTTPAPAVSASPEAQEALRAASRRLTELLAKKDRIEDGAPGLIWTQFDQQEYEQCYSLVYPEG